MESMGMRRERGDRAGSLRRSRTTSDFETLRPRASPSMSATSDSGSRTVSVFMKRVDYDSATYARAALAFSLRREHAPRLSVADRDRDGCLRRVSFRARDELLEPRVLAQRIEAGVDLSSPLTRS
jgi:hypothetical protein